MDDKNFYFGVFSVSTVLYLLLLSLLDLLKPNWFAVQMIVIPAFLILTLVGIYGSSTKKDWTTDIFLVFFASFAFNALYIISQLRIFRVYALIALSIIGLYFVVSYMDLYKRKDVIKEIVKQAELLKEAEQSVKELLKKSKTTSSKISKKAPSKKASPKKTSKKVTKSKKANTKVKSSKVSSKKNTPKKKSSAANRKTKSKKELGSSYSVNKKGNVSKVKTKK